MIFDFIKSGSAGYCIAINSAATRIRYIEQLGKALHAEIHLLKFVFFLTNLRIILYLGEIDVIINVD